MSSDPFEVKKRARDALMRLPNVVGVGVGPKLVDGKPVGEVAIKVYVRRKVPTESLLPEERVPNEIEGVPTDVEVQAPLQA